jgi:hypothetical protein
MKNLTPFTRKRWKMLVWNLLLRCQNDGTEQFASYIKCDSVFNAPKCPLSNGVAIVQTFKHFDNVISTCCENVVEVFESLTTRFWTMDTLLFRHRRCRLTYTTFCIFMGTGKIFYGTNLHSSGTKWLPIMTYIHKHPDIYKKLHKHNKLNISDLNLFHYTSSVYFWKQYTEFPSL